MYVQLTFFNANKSQVTNLAWKYVHAMDFRVSLFFLLLSTGHNIWFKQKPLVVLVRQIHKHQSRKNTVEILLFEDKISNN